MVDIQVKTTGDTKDTDFKDTNCKGSWLDQDILALGSLFLTKGQQVRGSTREER